MDYYKDGIQFAAKKTFRQTAILEWVHFKSKEMYLSLNYAVCSICNSKRIMKCTYGFSQTVDSFCFCSNYCAVYLVHHRIQIYSFILSTIKTFPFKLRWWDRLRSFVLKTPTHKRKALRCSLNFYRVLLFMVNHQDRIYYSLVQVYETEHLVFEQ